MAPKRPRNLSFDIELFKDSASKFGRYEEKALKIKIVETDNVSQVFPGYSKIKIDPDLEHLKLEEFDHDQILTFVPNKHTDLNDSQRRFLMKLKHVLRNSIADTSDGRCEPYVQAMVDTLLQECKLDDSMRLEMLPSVLKMRITGKPFSTYSDREGRKDDCLVWVLQETKHKHDGRYRNGEIQLVSAIIAACQQNHNDLGDHILPQVMYGINIKGDEVSIMRTSVTKEYLLSLFEGLPRETLTVKKYPAKAGLKLSSPKSRSDVLLLMTKLRKHALLIETGASSTS